jgi:hypothetical protein
MRLRRHKATLHINFIKLTHSFFASTSLLSFAQAAFSKRSQAVTGGHRWRFKKNSLPWIIGAL